MGLKLLDVHLGAFLLLDINPARPAREELAAWHSSSGLPLRKFFNPSGLLYKSLELKNRLPSMSEEDMLELLSTDGMLVKRPLLIGEACVRVGFKAAAWDSRLHAR